MVITGPPHTMSAPRSEVPEISVEGDYHSPDGGYLSAAGGATNYLERAKESSGWKQRVRQCWEMNSSRPALLPS